jgi:hypothetical protein
VYVEETLKCVIKRAVVVVVVVVKMELEKMGNAGLGTAHLRNFKKHASYFLRDSLKVARLAFVDVSAAEL